MTDEPMVRRRELRAVLEHLERGKSAGVLVLGTPGSGKTVLMRMLEDELRKRNRSTFYVPSWGMGRSGQVGSQIVRSVHDAVPHAFVSGRTLQSSTGTPPISEILEYMREASAHLTRPVLILDGLDEAADPAGTASTIEELSRAPSDWQIVVSSRPTGAESRFDHLAVVEVGPFTSDEVVTLLRGLAPESTDEQISEALAISGGLPQALRIIASSDLSHLAASPTEPQIRRSIEYFVMCAIEAAPDPAKVQALLERLALLGGRQRVAALATWSGLGREELVRLSDNSLISIEGDCVAFLHDALRLIIVARCLRASPFRLTDLRFGAEEAERDDLLDDSFVPRQSLTSILDQHRSIVVGDRGSGKSAIFRKLSAGSDGLQFFPVANTSDLMQKIAGTAVQDADTLRAAWLVVLAAVVAAAVPESAPKKLRREAAELRAAIGLPTRPMGRVGKALRAATRPFGGTTLRLAVGPVNLEAQLPDGGRSSRATVDVESFCRSWTAC